MMSPELKVEDRLRRRTQEVSVQTEATIPFNVIKKVAAGIQTNDNSLVKKATLPQVPQGRQLGKVGGLVHTLNSTIEKLQAHR